MGETDAGSELASMQTFAERKSEKSVISGHQVRISFAHFAQRMLLHTDKSHKCQGLSSFERQKHGQFLRGDAVWQRERLTNLLPG